MPPFDDPPLDAVRTEGMRAWSRMPRQVDQPDVLLRMARSPRRAVVAALDAVVWETEFDPFEREPDGSFRGQPMTRPVWDVSATVAVLRRIVFLLSTTAERISDANAHAVLKRYDASLARYLQRMRAGDVRLVPYDEDIWEEESWENLSVSDGLMERAERHLEDAVRLRLVQQDAWTPDLGTAYLREGATPELRRYLRAQRLARQRDGGEAVHGSLEQALASDVEHGSSVVPAEVLEGLRDQRRLQRAQRLHERRGGAGQVVEDPEGGQEAESGTQRVDGDEEPCWKQRRRKKGRFGGPCSSLLRH